MKKYKIDFELALKNSPKKKKGNNKDEK